MFALIYSIALYTSLARSSMRAHRWPGFDTPKSNKIKQRSSHTVMEIHGCETLKAHNFLTAADTLVKLYIFSLGSLRSFIWAHGRSIANRCKVPRSSPRGLKQFRIMQWRSVGRCISNLVELRWKMTVLAIFRLLSQKLPWHDLDLNFDLRSS